MKFYNGNNKNKVLPLVLAGIIIFSMLLGFFGVISGYAVASPGKSAEIGDHVFLGTDNDPLTKKKEIVKRNDVVNIKIYFTPDAPINTNVSAYLHNCSFEYDADQNGEIKYGDNGVYNVTFKRISYTGYGNTIKFDIEYQDGITPDETLTVTISECEQYSKSNEDDDGKDTAPAKPYIIVSNYSYGGKQVTAGANFQLNMKFYNTSPEISVENIIMEVNAGDSFTLANSSNKVFIKRLYAGESLEKSVDLQVKPNAEPKSGTVEITFTYDYIVDNVRQPSATCSEKIAIPVFQVDRFEVGNIELPTVAQVGEEAYLTIKLVNKGKSIAYNVSAEINGDFVNSGASQFIGNMDSGASKESDDLYIKADKPGDIKGELIIKYEDAANNQKQVSRPFTITVESVENAMGGKFGGKFGMGGEMIDDPMGGKTAGGKNNKLVLIISIAAGVLVIGGIAAFVIVKIVKKKRAMEDEDI